VFNTRMYWKAPSGPVTTRGLVRLGDTFARLRVARGFSQAALGDRIGLSQASISRFETGKQPGLGVRWLARMMIVLEVSADELERHLRPPERPSTALFDSYWPRDEPTTQP
jgi:transcriptional regulator with XRE-family HTH domain